jgi:shikimate dehydrogenase
MRLFGLIGYPLGHSFSKKYFEEKFVREGITDVAFENFSIPTIDQFPGLWKQYPQLAGVAVTIPYKQQVLTYLDELSPEVTAMQACNCIRLISGKLIGYNTDIIGFEQSLLPYLKPEHTQALILGSGGAAAGVAFVLSRLGIRYQFVSRNPDVRGLTYASLDAVQMDMHRLIINTTPLGTYPEVDTCAPIPYHYLTDHHHCFDLVYNPAETLFMQKAKAQGASVQNGYQMLTIQAEANWRIWNQ